MTFLRPYTRVRVGYRPNKTFLKSLVDSAVASVDSTREVFDSFLVRAAEIAENWMKVNARWKDQTGAARASLSSAVTSGKERTSVYLYYDKEVIFAINRIAGTKRLVDYSIFLENANAGRFSILPEGLSVFEKELMHLAGSIPSAREAVRFLSPFKVFYEG
ncbi:MAG: hypothetical protein QXS68_03125 [Candidatus Methanomethylicaceae archaeon]